jgi:hypothetical protein
VESRVFFITTDEAEQSIPYIRVYNDDGTVTEYRDTEANFTFDPSALPDSRLKEVDCITCHNRIAHDVPVPEDAVDSALQRGVIDAGIPEIKRFAVAALREPYATVEEGLQGIAALETYYKSYHVGYYAANADKVKQAVTALQAIYQESVFPDVKLDWNAHPSNTGHLYWPGCMRCHDGKHVTSEGQAIRLECNLCHSIPVISSAQELVTDIEVSRGPEPDSHKNPNWIALHRMSFDATCEGCHTVGNAGGTDNSSFCSNYACHGQKWTFAGLDAPGLAPLLEGQLPAPVATEAPAATETPAAPGAAATDAPLTYDGMIQKVLKTRCGACHSGAKMGGLDVTSYATLMLGGKDGAVIIPGDSAGSLLIEHQSTASHKGKVPAADLALVSQWIDAGAPEK